MPSTGNQTTVDTRLRQLRVRMVRQRHKTFAKVEDFVFRDDNGTKLMHRPGNIVFKITVVWGGGEDRSVHGCLPSAESPPSTDAALSRFGQRLPWQAPNLNRVEFSG